MSIFEEVLRIFFVGWVGNFKGTWRTIKSKLTNGSLEWEKASWERRFDT